MGEGVTFRADTRARVLEGIARGETPRRLRFFVEGSARELSGQVTLRLWNGRVVEAESEGRGVARALMRIVLAERGRIEIAPDVDPAPDLVEDYPSFEAAIAQAEAHAATLMPLIVPMGGLEGVVTADLDRLVEELARLPDAASSILRLADGVRTVAGILRDAPHDEVLTARILERLHTVGILRKSFVSNAAARDAAPASLPVDPIIGVDLPRTETREPTGWDWVQGSGTGERKELDSEIERWLDDETITDTLASDDRFTVAFRRSTSGAHGSRDAERGAEVVSEPAHEDLGARAPEARVVLPVSEQPAAPAREASVPPLRPGKASGASGEGPSPRPSRPAVSVPGRSNRGVVVGALVVVLAVAVLMSRFPSEDPPARASGPTLRSARVLAGLHPLPRAPVEARRVEALLSKKAYAEASELLRGLERSHAEDPAVWILSGELHLSTGAELARAGESVERALALDPTSFEGWVLRGAVFELEGRRTAARDAYGRALSLAPDHPGSGEVKAFLELLNAPSDGTVELRASDPGSGHGE